MPFLTLISIHDHTLSTVLHVKVLLTVAMVIIIINNLIIDHMIMVDIRILILDGHLRHIALLLKAILNTALLNFYIIIIVELGADALFE